MADRPLDEVYPVMFIDAIKVKVRDGKSPTGRSTSRSGSPSTGHATSSGCGPAPAVRDMERAQVRFVGLVLLPEVFPPIGVSLILKV